ncbi:MAG: c-type cytochrome domain-containing protein [Flavobacteriaceae bacterium]
MIALEFTTFIGRFHPLFVHLPIGFILLAIVLEWWERFKKTEKPSPLIPISWFIGGIAALTASLCGWYLGETGLYEEHQIFVHRWLGITLVPLAFLGWWIKKNPHRFKKSIQYGFNILMIIVLSIEGHKGANLTHGESYLTEFAPKPIKQLFGVAKDTALMVQFANPDSVFVFADLIRPIFHAKCVSCHGNEVNRGALNLSHPDSLQLGGDGGPVILSGDSEESELFKRITLPQENIKFMPPTRSVLTYDEIKTIAWWIDQGASFENTVSQLVVDDNMKPILERRYGLNTEPRPWYEKVKVSALDSATINSIQLQGFVVKTLGAINPLLDISYHGTELTNEKLAALDPAKNHITWLSLTETNVENAWLSTLGNYTNLTRLELDKTGISDEGIIHLKELPHLEVLNLYASKVSDRSLPMLEELPELKRVYLSGTAVTKDKVKEVSDKKKGLSIIFDTVEKR